MTEQAKPPDKQLTLTFTCPDTDFDWGDVSLGLKWVKKRMAAKDAFIGPGTGYHDEVEAQGALKVLEAVLKRYEQALAAAEQQEAEETWRGTHAPGSVPPWLSRREYEGSEE